MIIYIIIKMLVGYYFIIKKESIKKAKIIDISIDIIIILLFLMTFYRKQEIIIELLYWSLYLILIFILFRINNKILINFNEIISKMEKKEKIKSILLNEKVNKIIYYIIWSLPWNIGYWIYFWVMENGWYLRIWICSNRDIFFMRYFGWDSRDWFYNINNKLYENVMSKWIKGKKDKIYEMIYRIIYLMYWIRKRMLKINMGEYIWIRMVIFMYLTMFYLYGLISLQILNGYIFTIIIIVELLLIYNAGNIIEIWQTINKHEWTLEQIEKNKEEGILTEELWNWLVFMKKPMYIEEKYVWEVPIFIWDKTLSNSVTLNILYKYMIWVNKNTEGYYDRKMNIRSRIYRKKLLEKESIIWDILPRTRYVIMNLKNRKYNSEFQELILKNHKNTISCLSNNKNFYLSYYEKAYSRTSLLMLIYILRNNNIVWNFFRTNLINLVVNNNDDIIKYEHFLSKDFNYVSQHIPYFMILLYLYEKDKRLISSHFIKFFVNENLMLYELEEVYIVQHVENLEKKAKELEIPKEFCGISEYKIIFKIMGRIQLYEEEAIVWNKDLQEYLETIENKMYENGKLEKLYLDWYDDVKKNSFIPINLNGHKVPEFRYQHFCQKYFLYVFILDDNNNDFTLFKNIDYDKIECLFFKQYNDEDIISIIYYLMLQSFLGWSKDFYSESVPSKEKIKSIVEFNEEIDEEKLNEKF